MVFLLKIGRCYDAENFNHSAPLVIHFSLFQMSMSGRKPWTIVRGFDRN